MRDLWCACAPNRRVIDTDGKFIPENTEDTPTLPRAILTVSAFTAAYAFWVDLVPRKYRGLIIADATGAIREDEFPASNWFYENDTYTQTETGEIIKGDDFYLYRDDIIAESRESADAAAERLTEDKSTLSTYTDSMVNIMLVGTLAAYALGRGGLRMVRPSDTQKIEEMVQGQITYLAGMTAEIRGNQLSPIQLIARSRMYGESTGRGTDVARAYAKGLDLPAYPLDGSTECLMNCRCHWKIVEKPTRWEATWVLGPVKTIHCATCLRRSKAWKPYISAKNPGS